MSQRHEAIIQSMQEALDKESSAAARCKAALESLGYDADRVISGMSLAESKHGEARALPATPAPSVEEVEESLAEAFVGIDFTADVPIAKGSRKGKK